MKRTISFIGLFLLFGSLAVASRSSSVFGDITVNDDATIGDDLTVSGKADITEDIDAANSGQLIGPWYVDDCAQNLTDQVMETGGHADFTNAHEIVMPRAGSVVGIACYGNDAVTANTIDFDVTVDGTKTGLIAQLNTSETQTDVATQAKDTDTFTAGQRIGIKWTTHAAFTPDGTVDYTCTVLVEQ